MYRIVHCIFYIKLSLKQPTLSTSEDSPVQSSHCSLDVVIKTNTVYVQREKQQEIKSKYLPVDSPL